MNNVAIVGPDGFLGTELRSYFDKCSIKYVSFSKENPFVSDNTKFLIKNQVISDVIYLATSINPLRAEMEKEKVDSELESLKKVLEFLGEYGFVSGKAKQIFPSEVWRSWDDDEALIALGKSAGAWNAKGNLLMIQLRERGAVHGYLVLQFSETVASPESVEEVARSYAVALSLYLSLSHHKGALPSSAVTELGDTGSNQLSQRQISILRGMVEGKTNHELANELGFSVSTVRHETMRIYQALAVSDRKEAAKKALSLALI
jgi:DNA-binding CsgD family transcriptional regulator